MPYTTTPTYAVDLSRNNGEIESYHEAKSAGLSMIIVKASDGDISNKARALWFQEQVARIKETDMLCGAYDFLEGDEPGIPQSKAFLDAITPVASKLEFVALDLENRPPTSATPLFYTEKVAHIVQAVKKEYPKLPMYLYGSTPFLDQWLTSALGCSLWLAAYGTNDHTTLTPPPFKLNMPKLWNHFTVPSIHQYCSRGTVPGIGIGSVNLNIMF